MAKKWSIPIMPNRLAGETSPYLLQHADNPVQWFPWGPEALEKAHREDKPVFLSIGYAACHWCHVMAHESFEDPQVAQILNQNFVSIKVDREERPDLDSIYMNAVVAMTGQGGWPMSVFLTPDGKPFFGGTYFPPKPRYGMPSFTQILDGVYQSWRTQRENVINISQQVARHIQESARWGTRSQPVDKGALDQATGELLSSYDTQNGGWGSAPKFPQPMVIEFLLRQASRGNMEAQKAAIHALDAMSQGGIYDILGGGFHRYSTDAQWLVPHFEKMLYDNAQLALAYLHSFLLTGNPHHRQITEATLDFILREMSHPEGGFYSSLDADSEGEEGKYYVWSTDELSQVLSDPAEQELFFTAYGITPEGNFEGKVILKRSIPDGDLAAQLNLPVDEIARRLNHVQRQLFEVRSKRVPPGLDDKVLVSWNALALRAFAEAARYLHRQDYLSVAVRSGRFLWKSLHPGDGLLRSWRSGSARHHAFLEDIAGLAVAYLSLYQSDPDPVWYQHAVHLVDEMRSHYTDPQVGFFDTRDDQEAVLTRPKDYQDNAIPSGNALAAHALIELSSFNGDGQLRDLAEASLGSLQQAFSRYPSAFGYWLNALDLAVGPVKEAALLGDLDHPGMQALRTALWGTYRPRVVSAVAPFPPPDGSPPLLLDRPLRNGLPTVYICQNFACLLPVTTPDAMVEQLEDSRSVQET